MPHRVSSLASAVFASSLAAAMLLGPARVASAADGCIEKPDPKVNQAGHWYHRFDRALHRRCWFFEASEATVSEPASAERAPNANTDSRQSWFSGVITGLGQTFSPQPQRNGISAVSSETPQNTISDNSSAVTRTTSPRRPRADKIAKHQRSQAVPPPITNGAASAEQHGELQSQQTTETPQLTPDREALFQSFLKWYRDKSIFGDQ